MVLLLSLWAVHWVCRGLLETRWIRAGLGTYPNVLQLYVHTPDNQNLLFEENWTLESAVDTGSLWLSTKLTAWSKFNADQKSGSTRLGMKGKRPGRHAATLPLALSPCYADIRQALLLGMLCSGHGSLSKIRVAVWGRATLCLILAEQGEIHLEAAPVW